MSDAPPDANASWPASLNLPPLARVDLDDLLHEVLERVGEVVASRERLRALLDAVVAIGADLDLRSTLQRIVEAACRLAGARYGALGVIGSDRMLVEFITEGLTNKEIGERMFLAEKTVKNYVSTVLAKLGVERRTQAAVIAAKLLGGGR